MAKNIVMNVLTESGYEAMYPFNPGLILNGTFSDTSTGSEYQITIDSVVTPLTNAYGNEMGIIAFIPTITNGLGCTLSINGDTAYPILFSDGSQVTAETFKPNRLVLLKYYNNNFYMILDKYQIGLGNVDNTSDADKPASTDVEKELEGKLNISQSIPSSTNLNTYTTTGFYYCFTSPDTIVNKPVSGSVPFTLLVEATGVTTNIVKQTFTLAQNTSTTNKGVTTYVRTYNTVTGWTSWYQIGVILSGTGNPDNNIGVDGNIYIKYSN